MKRRLTGIVESVKYSHSYTTYRDRGYITTHFETEVYEAKVREPNGNLARFNCTRSSCPGEGQVFDQTVDVLDEPDPDPWRNHGPFLASDGY
jgi:hypothetical protein